MGIALRRGATAAPAMAHPRARPSLYPAAAWRRFVAAYDKGGAEFQAEAEKLIHQSNPADALVVAELALLANQLNDLLLDRVRRIVALGRLVPQSTDVHDALARAGLTWADTGLPEGFNIKGDWLPPELADAKPCGRGSWRTRPACQWPTPQIAELSPVPTPMSRRAWRCSWARCPAGRCSRSCDVSQDVVGPLPSHRSAPSGTATAANPGTSTAAGWHQTPAQASRSA
jgi:hypothetical protein